MCVVGEEVFSQSVKEYLTKFKWGNANQNQFFHEISLVLKSKGAQIANAVNIEKWEKEWICLPSFNVISIAQADPKTSMFQIS